MAIAHPRRRRADARPPRPAPFAPTPGALGPPDPEAVRRSVAAALEAAHRMRRPLTLVVLELDDPAQLALAARLVRSTLRESDGVWRRDESSLALLLADADGPSAEPALARVRLRLRREGLAGAASMGRAAAAPGIAAEDLLALARADRRPL